MYKHARFDGHYPRSGRTRAIPRSGVPREQHGPARLLVQDGKPLNEEGARLRTLHDGGRVEDSDELRPTFLRVVINCLAQAASGS